MRPITLAASGLIVLGLLRPVSAQSPIMITVDPPQLPATAGQQSTLTFQVNIPTEKPRTTPEMWKQKVFAPGDFDPSFEVTVTRGKLRFPSGYAHKLPYVPTDPRGDIVSEEGYYAFRLPRNGPEGMSAVGSFQMIYTVEAGPPGEVLINVKASGSLRAMNVSSGTTDDSFGARATLELLPVAGNSIPLDPPVTPPQPPDGEGLTNALKLAALAGVITALVLAGAKLKAKKAHTPTAPAAPQPSVRALKMPPPQPPATTTAKKKIEEPKPKDEKKPAKKKEKKPRPPAYCRLVIDRSPATVRGNGDDLINLTVTAVPSPGWTARFRGDARVGASRPGVRAQKTGEDASVCTQYFTARTVWEPGLPHTDGAPLRGPLKMSFSATAGVELTSYDGEEVVTWQPEPASVPLDVIEANPRVVATLGQATIDATGRDAVPVVATLVLFNEPAPEEQLSLARVTAHFRTKVWSQDGGGHRWTAPFLIRQGRVSEPASLKTRWVWTAGPMRARALAGRSPLEFDSAPCQILLLACGAEISAAPARFAPIPGTLLTADARITTAAGEPVLNPFVPEANHAAGAHMACTVKDLSRGISSFVNGCRIPPRLFDVQMTPDTDVDAAVKAALEKAPVINRPALNIDQEGRIHTSPRQTPATNGLIEAWRFELGSDQVPIDSGRVVTEITIDDGFDGVLVVRASSCVALGVLVLPMGGAGHRIREDQPFLFFADLKEDADAYQPKVGEPLQLRMEFAVMDAGQPVHPAGAIDLATTARPGKQVVAEWVLGHTPPPYVYRYNRTTRKVRRVREKSEGGLPADFLPVPDDVDQGGKAIRATWHALSSFRRIDPIGQWADEEGHAPWSDARLQLAVRAELRTAAGVLVATSDRQSGSSLRTHADDVWADHEFAYILLQMRLRLQDACGRSFADRPYTLRIDDGPEESGSTGKRGVIQHVLPAAANHGTLTLRGDRERQVPDCSFQLSFRYDGTDTTRGVNARLDNLGLHATGHYTDAAASDALTARAVMRFQQRGELDPTGLVDDTTRDLLRDFHVLGFKPRS